MKSNIDDQGGPDDQDNSDMNSSDDAVYNSAPSRKEKHINNEARRKIESYLEDRYLENELKDIFFDYYDD